VARRDLSRTVIEGGRYRYNKFERRASHGTGRAREREWLDGVRVDHGIADDGSPVDRPRVHRAFYDKLAVIRRWMRAQCGRPWDDVFSDLMARFDPRTVAGRHIVFDHMLREVRGSGHDNSLSFPPFGIDDGGILRALPTWKELRKQPVAPPWTKRRRAVKQDGRWWWIGDRLVGPCARLALCRYHHVYRGGVPHHYTRDTRLALLTQTELGRLGSLPARVRAVVLFRGDVVEPEHATLALPPSGT
jgi:hypothetical protein